MTNKDRLCATHLDVVEPHHLDKGSDFSRWRAADCSKRFHERDADWPEVAQIVLHREASAEPDRTRRCWEAHLKRARWIAEGCYRDVLERLKPIGRASG